MSRVASVETFIVTIARDTPYLGPLGAGERVNERGYVVRRGNGTIYPVVDRSVVVRITTDDGRIGWGETYGICAPRATCEIINDLLAPVTIGADPADVEHIWDELYGLMRVRGCSGGFHVDAIAAHRHRTVGPAAASSVAFRFESCSARQCTRPCQAICQVCRLRSSKSASLLATDEIRSGTSGIQVRRGGEPRGHRGGNGRAA